MSATVMGGGLMTWNVIIVAKATKHSFYRSMGSKVTAVWKENFWTAGGAIAWVLEPHTWSRDY